MIAVIKKPNLFNHKHIPVFRVKNTWLINYLDNKKNLLFINRPRYIILVIIYYNDYYYNDYNKLKLHKSFDVFVYTE